MDEVIKEGIRAENAMNEALLESKGKRKQKRNLLLGSEKYFQILIKKSNR